MTLVDGSVRDLIAAFGSSRPTPGGGSASALASAVGASLLLMVAGLPKTRSGSEDDRSALAASAADLGGICQQLSCAIDAEHHEPLLGGRFTFPGTSLSVARMGYGAMRLAGPHVWGHREIKAWQPCSPCSEALASTDRQAVSTSFAASGCPDRTVTRAARATLRVFGREACPRSSRTFPRQRVCQFESGRATTRIGGRGFGGPSLSTRREGVHAAREPASLLGCGEAGRDRSVQ